MQVKRFCFLLYGLIIISSCAQDPIIDSPTEKERIDSLIVISARDISLSVKDTITIDVRVYPQTMRIDEGMLKEHRIFLSKIIGLGGGSPDPSEYEIFKADKLTDTSDNIYRFFIKDNDSGHGYQDTVCVAYRNKDYYVVYSSPFFLNYSGHQLTDFAFIDGLKRYEAFNYKNDTIQVQVPNSYNLKNTLVSFKHNGRLVKIGDEPQVSKETANDYTDFSNPIKYSVEGFDGSNRNYTIEVFNLPIVYVNTPNNIAITSRYEWTEQCSFSIRDTNGSIEDYGEASVKGRGNWSWRQNKKPYAIKLSSKPKDKTVLGMPGHKRWVLLANPLDYLPNPIGFEVNRRTESCKWSPRSRYVELFLNGDYKGLYLLCEQIKIDKNRINIKELKKTDVDGDALTGGYLISYDDANEDDDPKFNTLYFNMPVMIKNPDADDIVPEQMEYIKNYIDSAEYSLFNDDEFRLGSFRKYFDIDSWIDYYFLEELWGAFELWRPRSVWMFKDRNGLLTAGPGWDYENSYFDKQELMCDKHLYYGRFLQDRDFIDRMQMRWPVFRNNLEGRNGESIVSYIDSLYTTIHYSARRDRTINPSAIPSSQTNLDDEYKQIRNGIVEKISWLEAQIMSW